MTTTTNKGHNMNSNLTIGSKYDSNLDVAQVAKLVRADLRAAVKAGELPKGCKFSVRIDRYSMGCSLDVTIKAVPEGFAILNPHREWWQADNPHDSVARLAANDPRCPRYTTDAQAMLDTITALVNAYNRKNIDHMSDYYCVSFSESIDFGYEVEKADRARVLASDRPELPPPAPLADGTPATCDDDAPAVGSEPGCVDHCADCGEVVKLEREPFAPHVCPDCQAKRNAQLAAEVDDRSPCKSTAPRLALVPPTDDRLKAAQAALEAADAAAARDIVAAPKAAQAPAQAPEVTFQTAPRVDASEYTADQLAEAAKAVAGAADLELVAWSIRVRDNGRISLVVKGTRTATVNGRELTVDATASLAL